MWEDKTIYTNYGKEREPKAPRTWRRKVALSTITVTRWASGDPDKWYLRCSELGFGRWELKSSILAEAQEEAVELAAQRLKELGVDVEGELVF